MVRLRPLYDVLYPAGKLYMVLLVIVGVVWLSLVDFVIRMIDFVIRYNVRVYTCIYLATVTR